MMLRNVQSNYSFLLLLVSIQCLLVIVFSTDHYNRADFPPGFVFGAGTSAYQVEGAAFEDGRTPSIWDTFAHAGFSGGANGDIACDLYHKYKEDVQLMAETGLEAYRFSISWSRLIPGGRGPVNPKGLQFYNNYIDELISQGIQPHVTLLHSDLPQVLEDEYGGWLSRKIVKDFTAYAEVCFKEFGDRVLYWTTINEANVFAIGGYDHGIIPPGRCSPPFGVNCSRGNSSTEPYIVVHNMLLAHSSTMKLYRRNYKSIQHGFVGFSIYGFWFVPYTHSVDDVNAAQRANEFYTGWIMNPLIFGDYPSVMKKAAGTRIPTFSKYEAKLVKGSVDFIGVNHYTTASVKDRSSSIQKNTRDFGADIEADISLEALAADQYPVIPSGLYEFLDYLKEAYGNPPIYIQENGQKTRRNGTLNDTARIEYLHAYIGSVLDAVRNGSDTRGYFAWSLLDGLELLGGYGLSYGLYYVDLDDKELTRYPKLSAYWYANFLKGKTSITSAEDKLPIYNL
ncbi:PREDICTED: beta-glucosidase 11-like isoform X1 [Nicotiana attenuata]|uniref:Beta-glucosidase 11 n=2 Tax=Nicotiana attenuata TaxID=49451 RepID=A0A1J6I384_NICAT|nr:PREDICTED: beta-glucosidase 11-like isoform X1 [Nicotiana attenuata]OIS98977.1 beta-glucosidase 11 [Nicotiana attenuata]